MSYLKKYNKETGKWDIIASQDASLVYIKDPSLLTEQEEETDAISVEDALKQDREDIEVMKRNISWLALHGGGGTGSGGGSSDIYGTITVRINNATISDNADVTISDKKAVVEYEITSKNPRLVYNLRMSLDGKVIHNNNNIIPNISSQTNSYEITAREFNSTGNRPKLSIQIYDTTENNFTFFNCNLVLTSLSLNVFNQTPDFTDRDSATLTFSVLSNITNQEHSVYVSTNPKLDTETYLDIDSAEEGSALRKLRHTYTVNQANSSYSVSFKYVDILPNITLGSSGTIYAFVRLSSDTSGSVKSKLYSIQYTWISSNEVVIQPVSPIVNLDNPASIIKSSVLSVSFIPYLQSSNGYGNCSIKATEGIITDGVFSASKASYTLSEEGELSCKFNEVKNVSYSDFASIDYFELGKLYRIEIQCTSTATNQTGIGYTYIFISTVSTNFLNVSDDNKLIFSLKAFQSSVNLNSDTLVQPFIFGQVTGKIKATLNSYNFGANSGNEGTYIRYSNKAHSVISNIRFEPEVENSIDYSKVKLFSSGISGISSGEYGIINNDNPEFSISVSFLADKKNTSDKIIFSFGDITKNSGDKSGYTGTGILITNHKYVVRLKSKVTGDITVLSGVLIDGNFINLTFVFNDNSAFKVYKNGVLLKVVALNSSPISEGQNIPLYTTILWELANFNTFKINHYNNSGTRNVNDYAEINLYNVSMYSTALNARECVCDYINNYLLYDATEDKVIKSDVKAAKLSSNLLSDDGSTSLFFGSDSFNDANWVTISGSDIQVNADITQALNMPVVLLDLSSDWTYNTFIQKRSSADALAPVNARFLYYDKKASMANVTCDVSVSLQGTSTLSYAIKNLEINFGNDNLFWVKSDWFPENSYTLKADVVDSSHANNASIGKFINDCCNSGKSAAYPQNPAMRYFNNNRNTVFKDLPQPLLNEKDFSVKATLEGFPVLLIAVFKGEDEYSGSVVKSLGIYSFNLGRNSVYNMGYKLPKVIKKDKKNVESGSAPILVDSITSSTDEFDCMAEAWEGDSSTGCTPVSDKYPTSIDTVEGFGFHLDGYFWSNNASILGKLWKNTYMHSGETADHSRIDGKFQELMNIIYHLPCGNTYNDSRGFNYSDPIKLDNDATLPKYKDTTLEELPNSEKVDQNIFGGENGLSNILNIESAKFYYVFCLFAGLVDNFGKNMVLRIWKNPELYEKNSLAIPWYLCFYDMDTAFGLENKGTETIDPDVLDVILTNTSNHNNLNMSLPSSSDEKTRSYTVYDNKLWSTLMNLTVRDQQYGQQGKGSGYTYSSVWNDLRSGDGNQTGILYNPKKFMVDYFNSQNDVCGELLFSQDYQIKYVDNIAQANMCNGLRQDFVEDWIDKRIKFLDSYFGYLSATSAVSNYLELTATSRNSYSKTITIQNTASKKGFKFRTTCPVIIKTNVDNAATYYTYISDNAPDNQEVVLSNDSLSSGLNTVFNYSDCIVEIEDFKNLNIQKITSASANTSAGASEDETDIDKLQVAGLSSFEELDLSDMKSLSTDSAIDFTQLFKNWNNSKVAFGDGNYADNTYPSELRVINLNNTYNKKISSFPMNLNVGFNSVYYKKMYSNITDIDIEGSSITSVVLPSNISLFSLKVKNSALTVLNLQNQALLDSIDVSGCSSLTKVSLADMPLVTSLTFDSLSNLNDISLKSLTSLTTLYISQKEVKTTSLKIALEDLSNLESITVDYGKSASDNDINLIGATNLKTLKLTHCEFETLILPTSCKTTLKTLDLSNSHIKNIRWNDGTSITEKNNILDLQGCSITSLTIQNNSYIENIQFDNIENSPVVLSKHFQGCNNLKRIYGNVMINTSAAFDGDTNFSIHGSDISEVLYDKNVNPIVVINNNLTIHPTENANAFISNSKMKFQSGLGVTNMSFSTSNASYTFRDTKCTTFDVYYILYNIGNATNLEGLFWGTTNCAFIYDKDELYINSMHRNTFINCGNVTNLIYAFRGTGTRQFLYSPKHTGGNGTSSTETSTLTDNNGLFTPLIKCTSIGAAFYGCYYVIDRFLFRRNDDEKFSITDMTFFEPAAIIDDTNAMDQHEGNISLSTAASIWDAITGTPSSMTGKLWGFFKDFKGMSTTNSAIEDPVGMFYGTSYINFDTLRGDNNQIPVRGSIQSCFNLKYASGELLLNELFKYPSLITALNSSFIIDNSLSNSSNNCTIKFTDDTFSAFINIREISYKVDGDLAKSAKSGSSFAGAGINKIIENSFPENIFQGLTNLKRVTALFTDCTFNNFNSSNSVLNLPGKVFANLHNLEEIDYLFYNFKTKTIKVNLTIEGGGFSSCVNLKSLRYLFAGTNNSTELLVTNTSIPYKLFYHGEKPVSTTFIGTAQEYYTESYATYSKNTITSSSVVLESEKVNNKVSILTFSGITNVDTSNKTFECTPTSLVTIRERVYNNDEDYDESTIWSGQYGNWENTKVIVSTEDFTYTVPNKSITNMEGCFSYSNIKPYVNVSPKPENNEYYNPYTYIKASNGVWNKATQNLHKETMIWEYDGFNLPASIDSLSIDDIYKKFDTCEYLDDIVYKFKNQQVDNTLYTITAPNITVCETTTTSDWHFATPPDLLRYCTSDAIIDKLFYGSGPEKNGDSKHTSFSQLVESGAQDNIPGLRGRICPYMLKPLPKLKSIKGLFAYCGLLTAYKLNEEKAYKIPKSFFYYTPEVTDLQEAFRNFEFPIDGTVNVFSSLTGLLNIKYIFLYSLWGGTATNQFDWSNTFSKNNVENVIACFSTNVYDGTYYSPINFKSAQYVNIGNNVFKTNTNYLDAKYVFSGYSNSTVSISSPLQLPQSDYNYASGNSANSVYTN